MFGSFYKTWALSISEKAIQEDLIEVHSQAISAVRAYAYWLSKYNTLTQQQQQQQQQQQFRTLVVSVIDIIMELFNDKVPTRISLAAAGLLVSITSTVKPSFFLALEQSQQFFAAADNSQLLSCPLDVQVRAR